MDRKQFLSQMVACGGMAAIGVLAVATPAAGAATRPARATSLPSTTLSAEEIAGLHYMREEEKLAHDVYVALHALWGTAVFSNIASSEAAHTASVLNLLNSYGLSDPAAGLTAGVFLDPALQGLYDGLMEQGQHSEIEALKVGALIEETDIKDIEERLAQTDEAAIRSVYSNLLCGSRNHLRAFDRQLRSRGVTYTPVVISQQTWDAIASSPTERCR